MKLPLWIVEPLARWLVSLLRGGRLAPHADGDIVSSDGALYMRRGWLIKPSAWTFGWSARIHHTVRSDKDRHLHDHPWPTVSVILRGSYEELMPWNGSQSDPIWAGDREMTVVRRRSPGTVVFRKAADRHRLIVPIPEAGCYSLFIMGPDQQSWGFYTPKGKMKWREYLGLPPKTEQEKY